MNISVKHDRERRERPHPRLPADRLDPAATCRRPPCRSRQNSSAKNVNATKPVMYIVSLVAKPSAISAPISARPPAPRPVEEAEHHHQQREADRREVDVLAGEAREVEVRRPDRQQHGRREGRHAPELVAQEVRHRDHRGAHQRGRQPGGEVGVAEEREHRRRSGRTAAGRAGSACTCSRPCPQDPGEVGVLALVVVERAVAEVVEPQPERHRDEDDVGDQLAARAPHVARAARSRASPP